MRAWQALPAFRGDSSARTWLLSIARRACADPVRRTRAAPPARRAGSSSGRTLPGAASTVDPSDAHAVLGAGRRAARRPARRVRAHPGGRVLLRGGGGGLRRAHRHDPVAGGAGPRAPASTRCAGRRPDDGVAARACSRWSSPRSSSGSSVATATPAGAHGLGGLTPTNYETVLQSVTPHVPGLHVHVTDLGTKVELTNDGARDGGGARLRRRAVPARRAEGRVREHALARDVPQPVDHHHRHAAEVGRREGARRSGGACPPGTTATLARPPRALHGRRRSAGGRSAIPTRGASSTTG